MHQDYIVCRYHNPHASAPLDLEVTVRCNTPDSELLSNVEINSARDLTWLSMCEEHDAVALLVGSGPSMRDNIGQIAAMQAKGAIIFAMNGSCRFLREHGILPNYQCVIDARPENVEFVERGPVMLLASQCHPSLFDKAHSPILVQLATDGIESHFPPDRVKNGGYALCGGGFSVGNSAICMAYILGFRSFHCFGYDSCHHSGKGHAFPQKMNESMPCIVTRYDGIDYTGSIPMAAQAETFLFISRQLRDIGCTIYVHGEGLLPSMYRDSLIEPRNEREKYEAMWKFGSYCSYSPGLKAVETFASMASLGTLIDFGCGSGKASVELSRRGWSVTMVDFARNCLIDDAKELPFHVLDLENPINLKAEYGYCCDVMEHIPPDSVERVINNIMRCVRRCFFQISTVPDAFGSFIGQPLHLSVHSSDWWRKAFRDLGYGVIWQKSDDSNAQFLIEKRTSDG